MQAVVLAAGYGSRLQQHGPSKPLVEVAGRALLLHVLAGLSEAGVEEAIVVTGHHADAVIAALGTWHLPLSVQTVRVSDPSLPNGVSLLAAAPLLQGRSLLAMSDHLVDSNLYRRLLVDDVNDGDLLLGVDRRIGHAWIDEDDVTRVQIEGDRIQSIGKGLIPYNGYDTGVFSVDSGLVDALKTLETPSLSQGVAILAAQGRARAVETGDLAWLDVDDSRAFAIAEEWLRQENTGC
jgi:1L-myo-inositol 1-phosphate cytidylyltransferase